MTSLARGGSDVGGGQNKAKESLDRSVPPQSVPHPYHPPPWGSSLLVPKSQLNLSTNKHPPIVKWNLPGSQCNLWIKRDDCLGLELSGNKVKSLEFLLADALEKGCDCVVTLGKLQSNHCRATAVAASQTGLSCYLLLELPSSSESPASVPSMLEGNLLITRLTGAHIKLYTAEDRNTAGSNAALLEMMAIELTKQNKKPYIIPSGGFNTLGIWGSIEETKEIISHMNNQNLPIEDIVVSTASCTTVAGLALGNHLANTGIRVHGVSSHNAASSYYGDINRLYHNLGANVKSEDICDIIDGYVGDQQNTPTVDDYKLLVEIATKTGILLDPVYALKAVKAILRDPKFKNRNVLYIHTGGLFNLYSHIPRLTSYVDSTSTVSPFFPPSKL